MATATEPLDRERWPYRMKDLCEASGLPRQAIHFYIQQGLLPPGHKTGRNMAFYGESHLERLRLIRELQHERFLPLKAIKALLDGEEAAFSPEQQRFLRDVRERLAHSLAAPGGREHTVDADELVAQTGVDLADVERAVELGILPDRRDPGGRLHIAEADRWLFELLGQLRDIGFTRELGFEVDDMAFYDELMSRLFQQEVQLLSSRLSRLPPERAATMIEAALPVVHTFLTRHHESRVRDFFANVL